MSKTIRTMEEFSAFVGLSRPTVSKYFNDPNSVRPSTRFTIEAALRKSGFRPSIFAVNLNRRRSNIIGVIVPDSTDPFYTGLTRRIEIMAEEAGLLAFVTSSDGQPDKEDQALLTFKSMNIAGAIIAPLGKQSHHENLARLATSIPIIYVDSPLDEVSSFVGTDNNQSVGLIVDYLCRSGEPPCFLGMPLVNNNAMAREAAYLAAMQRLSATPSIVPASPSTSWDFEKFGLDETLRLLQSGAGFPTKTVLCANDRIAFGVIAAAYRMGLAVGHGADADLRVAGHDNHHLSPYTCPPLTTVAQNFGEIGRLAVEMLLDRLEHPGGKGIGPAHERRVLLNAEIMLRRSA
jgi:DNA-binding LacI/PurR family transcriptional regulator